MRFGLTDLNRNHRSISAILIPVMVSVWTAGLGLPANACDPREECSRCVASAFGHCIKHMNDPVCEIRKKACQVPYAGPIATAPGTPLGSGGVLGPGGPGVGPVPGEELKNCLRNPSSCPQHILASLTYEQVSPIVDEYIQFLQRQGEGRWKSIPGPVISYIADQYPDVNLNSVRYAEDINTIHGQAITIGNEIFFPRKIDLFNDLDLIVLFHELEHVGQYNRRGGVKPFLAEYIAKIPIQVLKNRSFSVHDEIDLEKAAIAKSYHVAGVVRAKLSGLSKGDTSPRFCFTQVGSCSLANEGIDVGPGASCTCNTDGGSFIGRAD